MEAIYGEAVSKIQKEMQQLQQVNEKLEEQLEEAAAKQPKVMHASAAAADVEARPSADTFFHTAKSA